MVDDRVTSSPWRLARLRRAARSLALVGLALAGLVLAAGGPTAARAQDAAAPLRLGWAGVGEAMLEPFAQDIGTAAASVAPKAQHYATARDAQHAFCRGQLAISPDMILTTRRLSRPLVEECVRNGVDHMAEIRLGHSAVVLAVRSGSGIERLTARQVFLALAREVPDAGEFRRNTAIRWSDIDRGLPAVDIRFQLPPRDDDFRALFNTLVMQGGCRRDAVLAKIFGAEQRTARCIGTRADRVREIARELAVRTLLEAPEGTIGVVTPQDIARAGGKLVALALDGVAPTPEAIENGSYEYSTPVYLAARRGRALHGGTAAADAAVDRVIAHTLSDEVIGPDGLLASRGIVAMSDAERAAQRALFFNTATGYGIAATLGAIRYAAGAFTDLIRATLDLDGAPAPAGQLDFTELMDIAGYKTQEFATSVSIIPSAGVTFGIARELSAADQDYLLRKLRQDAHQRIGALPDMQRRIVRTVLDLSETAGYEISKVDIEFFPLPSAKLIVSSTDAPISIEAAAIRHAIDLLNERVADLGH
jgi:phosphate transport system substrate-binding protein